MTETVAVRFPVRDVPGAEGGRLDVFLAARIKGSTRSGVQKMVGDGRVKVEGRPGETRASMRVGPEDVVVVLYPRREDPPPRVEALTVLYEDDRLLVVDKPGGVLSHPTDKVARNSVTEILKTQRPGFEPRLAHRLDRETSGVLALTKDSEAARLLQEQFEDRRTAKEYWALVHGRPDWTETVADFPLAKEGGDVKVRQSVSASGDPALTEFRVLSSGEDASLVLCRPKTGRLHQLRVHLAHLGHPILGDLLYGSDPGLYKKAVAGTITDADRRSSGAERQMLHAARLAFLHPTDSRPVTVEAPTPSDFLGKMSALAVSLPLALCLLTTHGWGQGPPPDEYGDRPPPGFDEHRGPPGGGFPMPPEQTALENGVRQLESAKASAGAGLARLSALKELYADPPDFDKVIAERAALRMELAGALQGFEAGTVEYSAALKTFHLAVQRHHPEALRDGSGPLRPYRQALKGFEAFSVRLRSVLDDDEAAFKEAEVLARRDRRRYALMGGGVLAVLLVGGGFLRFQRRAIATAVADATERATLAARATPPRTVSEEPGRVIGENFRIEKLLGTGGMGVVYLAEDLTLRRRVAIKRMREELMQGGGELEAFLNEARLVAALKHPNIVEILSIVKEPGVLYLVFEYVEGKSLREWIALQRQLPLPGVKSVVHQVSQALDYAHAQKIVHRDLKPANVMVDMKGVAKVMDFGIAHQAQMTLARVTHTNSAGTPAYMAPEQELGAASRGADVFAAGVCLYEMLTGRLPYNGPNFLAQKMAMQVVPPSALVPTLPRQIDAITMKALAADPAHRFASAGELSQAVLSV
ncbi:RluA family pseudouridine synthase [bacterium]|nr:MAG: RluA family pseudouridine synthase [bacterium]